MCPQDACTIGQKIASITILLIFSAMAFQWFPHDTSIYFQFHSEMSKPQYNCIYCGQFMTTREANRIHIQQECLERPDAALPCACLFCGLRFPSKASLRVHLSRWCKEKWFSLFFWCFLLMKYMTLYWYSAAVQHLFLGAISNFATGFQKVNVSQNKMSKGCLYIPIY